MTILSRLAKLHVSNMEIITLSKNGVVIYRGTIINLINTRKDLLKLNLIGDLEYKAGDGYFGNCR